MAETIGVVLLGLLIAIAACLLICFGLLWLVERIAVPDPEEEAAAKRFAGEPQLRVIAGGLSGMHYPDAA